MRTIILAAQSWESTIDFASHITKVLFTSGCNFRCSFCHNCHLWENNPYTKTFEELDRILKKAKDNWCDAVCITGGEPSIHRELPELIRYIKKKGFMVKLDTNSTDPEMIAGLTDTVDYFAVDYKASLARYREITKADMDYSCISEGINILKTKAADYELRTTVIPGFHDEKEIRQICTELQGVKRYILQPFVPREELLDNDFIRVKRTEGNHLQTLGNICRELMPGTDVKVRSS